MTHEVYISCSAEDKSLADAVRDTLESNKFDCWIAPRDIPPGQSYAAAITNAIKVSQVFVLVLSETSNRSAHVLRDVGEAITAGIPIITLRIDDLEPSGDMRHYIMDTPFWLDVFTPPLDQHLERLTIAIRGLLAARQTQEDQQPMGVEHLMTEDQVSVDNRETTYSATEKKATLAAFAQVLLREAHVLQDRPEILWQQLYNRLQWEDRDGEGPVSKTILPEFNKRTSPGAKHWFHNKVRVMESESFIRLFQGHTEEVSSCAFSPDGRTLVSASRDGTLRLWDVHTGEVKALLKGHTSTVNSCTFSPDGRMLASASGNKLDSVNPDYTLRLWDVHTGEEQALFQGHTDEVSSCAFSPDNRTLASASNDGTLRLWNILTGDEKALLNGHTSTVNTYNISPDGHLQASATVWIRSCTFSPNGRTLASASHDTTLRLWDVRTGEAQAVLKGHTKSVNSCVFSPDGRTLASASDDETLRLWDVYTGKEQAVLKGHTGFIWSCVFSPDGRRLASASKDGTLRLWDVHTGDEQVVLRGHTDFVSSCIFSPDGRMLASASWDKTLRLWDVHNEDDKVVFRGHTERVASCSFSSDGRMLASASWDKTLRLWNVGKGELQAVLKGHPGDVQSCAFSPDGRTLASASNDETLRLWDVYTGKEQAVLKGHTGVIWSCVFSPDGRTLASASDDETLRLWDVHTGEAQTVLKGHYGRVNSCSFSPNGRTLASASDDETLRLWDVHTGEEQVVLRGHYDSVNSCVFSPDGSMLASASSDKMLRLWDVYTGKEQVVLKGHTGFVWSCAFSPDGHMLASASDDGTIRLWNVRAGEEQAVLKGHTESVNSCSFSPDGLMLVSASSDKTLRLWDVRSGELIAQFLCVGNVYECFFSPNGKMLATGDIGGNVYLLDMIAIQTEAIVVTAVDGKLGPEIRCPDCQKKFNITIENLDDEVTCPQKGCDTQLKINQFLVGEKPKVEKIASIPKVETELRQLIGHQQRVSAIIITPEGEQIITGSHDSTIKVWDLKSGEELRSWHTQDHVDALALEPNGGQVLSIAHHPSEAMIKRWDFIQGKLLIQSPADIPASLVSLTRNGGWAIIAHENKGMLWDLGQNLITTFTLEDNQVVSALVTTPDGRASVIGTDNGKLFVWDLQEGEELLGFDLSGNPVSAVAVSDNAKLAICATQDHVIRVYDIENKKIHIFRGHTGAVTTLVITHDQQRFISISQDGTIKIWHLETRDVVTIKNGDTSFSSCVVSPDGLTLVAGAADGKVYIIPLDEVH